MSQQFCLKWNSHMTNMMDVFKGLLSTESMVDCTLACDGLSLKAHKIVLSACSPFFQALFLENPCKHPIVILKDMKYTELKAIIEFMYHGEVNVGQDQLSALMKTAETLRVKGLAEVTNEKTSQSNASGDEPSHRSVPRTETPPPSKRRRRTRKRSLSDSNRSDDESNEPKVKQPMSPDIEELSGDHTMEATSGHFSSIQSQVPMQQMPSHSTNSFQRTNVAQGSPHVEEPTSADESEFGVEPAKLLEQTLTTDDLANARRGRSSAQSSMEMQRRSRSTDHSSSLVPTSMPSDSYSSSMNQQLESPPDIKPELLDLDPPISPVPGPSHSADNSMMFDQSSVSSHPGTSFQDNSGALVPQDSSPQEKTFAVVKFVSENDVAVVPVGWIDNGQCFWPPIELQGMVVPDKFEENPDGETWEKHRVKILGFYATYKEAESKLFAVVNNKGLAPRQEMDLLSTSTQLDVENMELEELPPIVINLNEVPKYVRNDKGKKYAPASSKGVKVSSIVKQKTNFSTAKSIKGEIEIGQKTALESLSILELDSQKIIERESQKPSSSTFAATNDDWILDMLARMPVKSVEHLESLEQTLSDAKAFQQMVHVLKGIGGRTGQQLVTLMLRKVMKDQCAQAFSLYGKKGKRAFKNLRIYFAILTAVRTNIKGIAVSGCEVDNMIAKWLKHAKARTERDGQAILESISRIMEHESQECKAEGSSEPNSQDSVVDLMFLLPVQSDVHMGVLEQKLSNKETLEKMVHILMRVGGSSGKKFVTLMLRKIMTNQYATTYSFLGLKGKKPFKGLKIYHAILSAVRKNKQGFEISEYDVEAIISAWLKHAKARSPY